MQDKNYLKQVYCSPGIKQADFDKFVSICEEYGFNQDRNDRDLYYIKTKDNNAEPLITISGLNKYASRQDEFELIESETIYTDIQVNLTQANSLKSIYPKNFIENLTQLFEQKVISYSSSWNLNPWSHDSPMLKDSKVLTGAWARVESTNKEISLKSSAMCHIKDFYDEKYVLWENTPETTIKQIAEILSLWKAYPIPLPISNAILLNIEDFNHPIFSESQIISLTYEIQSQTVKDSGSTNVDNFARLITEGENENVEFKSTLRWNIKSTRSHLINTSKG